MVLRPRPDSCPRAARASISGLTIRSPADYREVVTRPLSGSRSGSIRRPASRDSFWPAPDTRTTVHSAACRCARTGCAPGQPMTSIAVTLALPGDAARRHPRTTWADAAAPGLRSCCPVERRRVAKVRRSTPKGHLRVSDYVCAVPVCRVTRSALRGTGAHGSSDARRCRLKDTRALPAAGRSPGRTRRSGHVGEHVRPRSQAEHARRARRPRHGRICRRRIVINELSAACR